MVERRSPRAASRGEKTRDPRSVKKFLEELFWVLSSNSHIDFRAVSESFEIVDRTLQGTGNRLSPHVSRNPNIHFLIGTLPGIFSNEKWLLAEWSG